MTEVSYKWQTKRAPQPVDKQGSWGKKSKVEVHNFPHSAVRMAFVFCVFVFAFSALAWVSTVLFHRGPVEMVIAVGSFVGWLAFLTAVTRLNYQRARVPPSPEPPARLPGP